MSTEKESQDRTIDYIEFNVADIARSKDFYGRAFGWRFTNYGPDYCEFSDGHMKGGFDATGPVRPGGALVVLYGEDLVELQSRIEETGGMIVKPIFEFPGGRRFHFTDPDGYELAVWTKN
jgi:predicted enzyme related to lactoylglutathione lyase